MDLQEKAKEIIDGYESAGCLGYDIGKINGGNVRDVLHWPEADFDGVEDADRDQLVELLIDEVENRYPRKYLYVLIGEGSNGERELMTDDEAHEANEELFKEWLSRRADKERLAEEGMARMTYRNDPYSLSWVEAEED